MSKNKKDIIVASISLLVLILLILSTILYPFGILHLSMRLGLNLDPIYDLGTGGGYGIAAALVIGLAISCIIGIIILILMVILRRKANIHKNLLWLYFLITFLMQSYFICGEILYLVGKQHFNVVKIINTTISLFMSLGYVYFPAIIMLLVYLIIRSVSNIRKNNR